MFFLVLSIKNSGRGKIGENQNVAWADLSYILYCKETTFAQRIFMIKRGEMYYADLSPVVGSEQGGVRPILIVQNDTGNKFSPTIIAAAITSKMTKAKLPTHIEISAGDYGLVKNSVILLEQIRTLDKRRLKERIGELSPVAMQKVDSALLISLGFNDNSVKNA